MNKTAEACTDIALLLQTEEDFAALYARLLVRFDLASRSTMEHPMQEIAEKLDQLRWDIYGERIK
jgi:hypothetical protein